MATKIRLWVACATLVAVLGFVAFTGTSDAGDAKAIRGAVAKIGEQIQKGDDAGAKKAAAATAKSAAEVGDVMHMFRPRSKGGMGFGEKAGSNPAKDGIEVALRDIARDGANFAKQGDGIATTGYWIAALADVTGAMAPAKDQGKKTKKAWNQYSDDMRVAGLEFAKAKGDGVKKAAAKVNASCNNCHSIFKE